MKFDFWFGHSMKDVAFADCEFYPNEGVYRGNMYDSTFLIIGDFCSRDSTTIEKKFPGIFND